MTSGRVSGMSLCEHKGLSNDTKNKFNNHHVGRETANVSCLAGMWVHKMEKAIWSILVWLPTWHSLWKFPRAAVILLVGVQVCGTAPRSLTHTHRYTNAHIYSLAWIFLLKFIYVTDWLDPKSHLHILMNKFFFTWVFVFIFFKPS